MFSYVCFESFPLLMNTSGQSHCVPSMPGKGKIQHLISPEVLEESKVSVLNHPGKAQTTVVDVERNSGQDLTLAEAPECCN